MYLENSEQSKVSGEGQPSTEAMLAEQCQLPKLPEAADLNSSSKGHTELGIKVLVEYTEPAVSGEMDPSVFCVEDRNVNTDETETCTYCNGHSESIEQDSEASDGFLEPDGSLDNCETSGLSQTFDKCCECFKPCESFEHCANHSLTSKCSSCCEPSAEHLQLCQPCKPSDQQSESSDFDLDELGVTDDCFVQCDMSDFAPECADLLQQREVSQQQSESFDSEPDTSTEDSEQCDTPKVSESADSIDCVELCEYDEIINQADCTYDDEIYEPEMGLSDEESEDTPVQVYFDDSEDVTTASKTITNLYTEDDDHQTTPFNMSTDCNEMCAEFNPETPQEYFSEPCCLVENSLDICAEEDGSSDCSSMETKSFKTCPDESIPSDLCSDSSEESEKGAQEDSSDEQTQWESFEEDEVILENNVNEDKKNTPTVNIVIEDYFDLFDRSDYGQMFAQKRQYISCFDGGDIHDRLHLEEEAQIQIAKNAYQFEKETKETEACSEEDAPEDEGRTDGSDDSAEQLEDWDSKSHPIVEDEENELETDACYIENNEEEEDDEVPFDEEALDNHVSQVCDEEECDVCLSFSNEDSMSAPCAKAIYVEGDAYEDEIATTQKYESLDDADDKEDDKDKPDVFLACSEVEPYWSLTDKEEEGELSEHCAEDYYAYQIKSIQSSLKQALNEFIMEVQFYSSKKERKETRVFSEDCKSVRFGITEIIELNWSFVENLTNDFSSADLDEWEVNDMSKEIIPPLDIIHSVTVGGKDTLVKAEQSRDSEEEQSDDESLECDCEYCISPIEKVL